MALRENHITTPAVPSCTLSVYLRIVSYLTLAEEASLYHYRKQVKTQRTTNHGRPAWTDTSFNSCTQGSENIPEVRTARF